MSEHAQELTPLEDITRVLGSENARRRRSRLVTGGLALAVLAALAVLVARQRADVGPVLQLTEVVNTTLEVAVTAVGTIEPLDEVDVASELSGILREVVVQAGDTVEAGQVLARLDPEMLEAQADQARAQLRAAEASLLQFQAALRLAARNRDTATALAAEGAGADDAAQQATSVYEQAVATRNAARAQVRAGRAVLRLAEVNLERSVITAPISGVVLTRNAEVGQAVVSAFQTQTLFVIAQDLGNMQVVLEIDEADIARVRVGQEVRFTVAAHPERTFLGSLVRVGLAPKPSFQVVTYEAIVAVDNADKALVPGMTASASIVTAVHPDVLVVPNAALRYAPQESSAVPPSDGLGRLYLSDAGGPRALDVVAGATDGRVTVVSGPGLVEGASVVLSEGEP